MIKHQLWLWAWFILGTLTYMLQRAYFLRSPRNPRRIANSYAELLQVAGVPMFTRFVFDCAIYWMFLTPTLAVKIFTTIHFDKWAWAISVIGEFGAMALFSGLVVDVVLDFGISTVANKIPFVKDIVPQMPPPLDPKA